MFGDVEAQPYSPLPTLSSLIVHLSFRFTGLALSDSLTLCSCHLPLTSLWQVLPGESWEVLRQLHSKGPLGAGELAQLVKVLAA